VGPERERAGLSGRVHAVTNRWTSSTKTGRPLASTVTADRPATRSNGRWSGFVSAIAGMFGGKLLLSIPSLARGGGRACLDRLVAREAGKVALATRFSTDGPAGLEGLILVMPEPARLPELLASLADPR